MKSIITTIQAIIVILGFSLIIYISGLILLVWGESDLSYLPYADIQLINIIYDLGHDAMILLFISFPAILIGILIFELCSRVEELLGEED